MRAARSTERNIEMSEGRDRSKAGRKRLANMELLRIIAMMMVVMLHYLSKGKVLPALTGELTGNGYAAWILETFSIVAVNVYMLISGFFLVESGFKVKRLVQLLCQVLFYSILIPLVLLAMGIMEPKDLNLYQLLVYIFPNQMLQYWFVTAYVIMYLFSPFLSAAVKSMSKKQLQCSIFMLLLFFSISKSVIPVRLEADNLGNDGLWFLCVYLIAAYMRLYGIKWFSTGRKSFLAYVACVAGMFTLTMGVRFVYLQTGQLEYFIQTVYGYNHILNLLAAISLFYGFFYWKLQEGLFARIVCRIAPYTFGVYLLHEQVELRYRWPVWIGASGEGNVLVFVLRAFGCVLAVFAIGIIVDMLRGILFGAVEKLLTKSKAAV